MGRPYGSRTLLTASIALVVLLGALAAVQYRWSGRVAAADAQREKEHLNSAAALFAPQLNTLARQTVTSLQNDAWAALREDRPLSPLPKLIAELYFVEIPEAGPSKARQLGAGGIFESSVLPQWAALPHCSAVAIEQPPALVVPIYEMSSAVKGREQTLQIVTSVRQRGGRCFVARIDLNYLRDSVFPQLIRRSFGATAISDYDFAVVSRNRPKDSIYGSPRDSMSRTPDVREPFLSVMPAEAGFGKAPIPSPAASGESMVIVQRVESTIVTGGPARIAPLLGPGVWELQVAHKGMPLAAAFERTRRWNLLASLAVEALLLVAIGFLMMATRRMQLLAARKMQFVAGVSHELRTPVSAIAMLSRNQADGLVSGADRVKQYGELIHQQSRRLNEMVEQALQYAGIHSGLRPPSRNTVDLKRLIEETVDARRDDLIRSGFAIEIALPAELPPLLGDSHWLRTAIDNLLSNAQKHAEGGRWIRVSAACVASEKEVRISVEDRGAGIPQSDQAEIFEPFSRGRAAIEAQIPGSGLGLSLVRSAAEVHCGSVTLVSEPGRGSTFTLHLPI